MAVPDASDEIRWYSRACGAVARGCMMSLRCSLTVMLFSRRWRPYEQREAVRQVHCRPQGAWVYSRSLPVHALFRVSVDALQHHGQQHGLARGLRSPRHTCKWHACQKAFTNAEGHKQMYGRLVVQAGGDRCARLCGTQKSHQMICQRPSPSSQKSMAPAQHAASSPGSKPGSAPAAQQHYSGLVNAPWWHSGHRLFTCMWTAKLLHRTYRR